MQIAEVIDVRDSHATHPLVVSAGLLVSPALTFAVAPPCEEILSQFGLTGTA